VAEGADLVVMQEDCLVDGDAVQRFAGTGLDGLAPHNGTDAIAYAAGAHALDR
jgi:hypothetical protein